MKRIAVSALLGVVLATSASAAVNVAAPISQEAPADRLWDDLRETISNVKHRPANEVFDLVKRLIASPDFKLLDSKKRQVALMMAAGLAAAAKEPDEAARLMAAATDADPSNRSIWMMRLAFDQKIKSTDDAVALTGIASRWPEMVRTIDDQTVLDVVGTAHSNGDPHELALLSALYALRWSPSDPLESASYFWRDLALLLIGQGKPDRALAVTRDLSDPYAVISIRSDRRFDALVKVNPASFDVTRIAMAQLDDVRARAEAAPDQLEIANGVVVALLRRNRPEEALALTDQLLGQISADSTVADFVDLTSEAPWTRLYRARALRNLGRDDEAFAEARRANSPNNGPPTGPVVIDVAQLFYEAGRPDEALATVAVLSNTEGEMRMQVEQVNVCSYAQKGDKDKASSALTYLRAHEADSLDALELGLLCADDQNDLAKLYIRHLNDPGLRAEMLAFLQDYSPPAAERGYITTLEARRAAVVQRPDVTAAVKAVGRISAWPLQAKRY